MTERQTILTPFFLDEHVEPLEAVAQPAWRLNRPALPAGETQARLVALYRPLRDVVARAAAGGARPLSVAGDCCPSLAVLAGLQQAEVTPTLIWFDAHGDFNTWQTTPSGFLGGMPLAMAVGRGEQTIVDGLGLRPLPEEKVILADARDLDPAEGEALRASAVTHLPQVEALLERDLPPGPLYVHFDCDVLDPQEAPAMKYPAPGGPSPDTLRRVFRRLAVTDRLVALSLSAWDPELDEDGRSRAACMELLDVPAG
jgi:arginase